MAKVNKFSMEDLHISDINFLSAFKNKKENVFFRMIHDEKGYSKNDSSTLDMTDDEYLYMRSVFKRQQKKGYGVFFTVNSGGTKKNKINTITANFIDVDFGKTGTGKKRTKKEVQKLKKEFTKNLHSFVLEPSIIVETCNGLHVYWLINRNKPYDIKEYRPLQLALSHHFGQAADDNICDTARIMRIPGYKHLKNPKQPFKIKCIKFNPHTRYTQEQISDAVKDDLSALNTQGNTICYNDNKEDMDEPRAIIKKDEILFKNHPDAVKYIRTQNPIQIFKKHIPNFPNVCEDEAFQCIFHNDSNPSAKISKTQKGDYKYFCFGRCSANKKGEDIFDIIGKVKGWGNNLKKTIQLIMEEMNIGIVESEWIKSQKEKYELGWCFKYDKHMSEDFREKFPLMHQILDMGKMWEIWNEICGIGFTHIDPEYQHEGEGIVFFSNRFIQNHIKDISQGYINQHINLLATLGIIKKIKDKDIPKKLLSRAIEEYKKNEEYQEIICFYTVELIYNAAHEAERRAGALQAAGFKIHDISRRYLIDMFGKEFADNVYDNRLEEVFDEKKETDIYECLKRKLEKKHYISFKNIKTKKITMIKRRNGNIGYMSIKDKERLFKRCIERLKKDYNIKKIKLNKHLKEKLGIKDEGYYEIYYLPEKL